MSDSNPTPDHRAGDLLGAEGSLTLLADVDELDAAVPPAPGLSTLRGLVHLLTAVAVLLAAAIVPYTFEDWADSRLTPWTFDDGVPVVRMFLATDQAPTGMSIATGGAARPRPRADALSDSLGDAVADNLVVEPPAPRDPARPPEDRLRIDPSEYAGLVLPLEDDHDAMAPFYRALRRTARREPGAITRVAHYGDSSIAGDGITVTLRRRFQQRFGDAGHGFVLIARGTMPYRHQDIEHRASDNWRLSELVRAGLRDHRYGYGGVLYRGAVGETAHFETDDDAPVGNAVSRFVLFYQAHPRGGRVELRVDDGERQILETRADEVEDRIHVVEVPDGPHELDLRTAGGGESRLYGMVLERDGPGVAYDSLGMVGARARRMLGYDEAHFHDQHALRDTNLVVLAFGGNDADDARTPEQFEEDFRRVAHLVRTQRPEAACLLMAPLDQARRDARGRIQTLEPVPVIVEAMRRAAEQEGCAFFDTYQAMGGEGAMARWFRTDPRLAFADFRHATPAGYQVIGNMFYKALLKGFADYLAAHPNDPT